jgi:hypothetical protein
LASPLHANLILPLHNRAGKGEHPAKCFLTCRNVEIELIFMRQRRAVFSREEKAVRPDAEVFELPRQGRGGGCRRAWRAMKRRFRALSILSRPERLYGPSDRKPRTWASSQGG